MKKKPAWLARNEAAVEAVSGKALKLVRDYENASFIAGEHTRDDGPFERAHDALLKKQTPLLNYIARLERRAGMRA